MAREAAGRDQDILLKGGLIVDGSGGAPYTANLLIRSGRIHRISPRAIRTTGLVIDCAAKVVAPGFIDAHSHLDWHLFLKGHDELKFPFLAQGITTAVAGNCGAAAAGFRENSPWKARMANPMIKGDLGALPWDTVDDYLSRLASAGASHNIALLAGHGTSRASIRGNDASPLHPYETKELLWLLENAMDQGARGVSLGLQYEPGAFARPEELREIALLVKKKGKILAVHPRLCSAPPSSGRARLFAEADSLPAIRELLDLARKTGVRLQISHLLFVGSRTWRSAEEALQLIDAARADGVDVWFDVCPYHRGASVISVVFPAWFLAQGPGAYDNPASLRGLKGEIRRAERFLGFGPSDMRVTATLDPDLAEYDGKHLREIARLRRMSPVDALIDLARRSAGKAKVLLDRLGNEATVESLVKHHAALFMTDAWVERAGIQNPAAFGAFPRLLQLARERRLLSLEEAVRKMSGATAERFGIEDRGLLKEGLAADITVFDWENVRDNTTMEKTRGAPDGIDYVFVNGRKIIGSGKKENPLSAGIPLR